MLTATNPIAIAEARNAAGIARPAFAATNGELKKMLVDGAANAADITPTASPPMAPDRRRLPPGRRTSVLATVRQSASQIADAELSDSGFLRRSTAIQMSPRMIHPATM